MEPERYSVVENAVLATCFVFAIFFLVAIITGCTPDPIKNTLELERAVYDEYRDMWRVPVYSDGPERFICPVHGRPERWLD